MVGRHCSPHVLPAHYLRIFAHDFGKIRMDRIKKFYNEYKPYIFSDGWYYVFIVVFILILFIFFS